MAKKKKKRGVKTYKPHNVGTILYALFGLAVIACLAVFALFPFFYCIRESAVEVQFTGLEFLELCFRKFINGIIPLPTAQIDIFEAYLSTEVSNVLLQYVQRFHEFVELGIGGLMAFSAFWAIFQVIACLLMLLFGKTKHPKDIKNLAWTMFWFFAIGYGLAFMYFVFVIQIAGNGLAIKLDNYSLIALGAMLGCSIILSIIYRITLKDRIPLPKKKKRKDDDDDDDEEEEEKPAPKEEKEDSPRQVNEEPAPAQEETPAAAPASNEAQPQENKDQSVITIGNSAYKKNIDITVANIPEGIVSLGSSAFANCVNLQEVNLPGSLREISFNCFFNTPKLTKINYAGTVELWKTVKRGSNWLTKSGTKTINCTDGQINVNPSH